MYFITICPRYLNIQNIQDVLKEVKSMIARTIFSNILQNLGFPDHIWYIAFLEQVLQKRHFENFFRLTDWGIMIVQTINSKNFISKTKKPISYYFASAYFVPYNRRFGTLSKCILKGPLPLWVTSGTPHTKSIDFVIEERRSINRLGSLFRPR